MNIDAVARLAKVSTATVSRTINGSAKVSPGTAARVRNAVETLNFHPNINARALGTGRSRLFGLIISDITNPFFPELVKAFEDVAVEHGQEVLIANTNYDVNRMERCVSRMLQRQADGVAIMTSQTDSEMIEGLSSRGIPLVFLDSGTVGAGVSRIRIEYKTGIDLAMQHLTGLGHERIAYISGPVSLASARSRFQAFEANRERYGLRGREEWVAEGNHQIDGGSSAMRRILAASGRGAGRPTAVIASNDLMAIGAISAIRSYGLRVPEDISLVGFDDIQFSSYTQPALTTVHLPRVQIAKLAFHALFARYESKRVSRLQGEDLVVQPHLVVRDSTMQAAT